jgi:protein-S-isoprenylcysteine O-methyltransferase Ste14
MRIQQLRRCLFLAFLVQEGVVFLRATPDERAHAPVPPFPALFGVALLAPLVLASAVPRWLERLALFLQVAGWALEIAAMTQLVREQSFGIHPTAATKPLQTGFYRFEHPIYLGLLVSIAGWTLPMPPCLVAVVLTYRGFRRAVGLERAHLASLHVRHRGIESFLWFDEP